MGGLREDRSEKGRGGRKVEREGQQHGPMGANYERSRTSECPVDQPHPYTKEPEEEQYACRVGDALVASCATVQ